MFHRLFCAAILLFSASFVYAQKADNGVLATAAGKNFTSADLSPEVRDAYEHRTEHEAEFRGMLIHRYIAELAIELESKTTNKTEEEIVADATAKITEPTEKEMRDLFAANADKMGGKTFAEVQDQIKEFMMSEARRKTIQDLLGSLAVKHKITAVGDIAKAEPAGKDVVLKAGDRSINYDEFKGRFKLQIYDDKMELLDAVRFELEDQTYLAALEAEAAERKTDVSSIIAAEITNKLRDYSDIEKYELDNALRDRLAKKYNTKIFLPEPPPIVQDISTDDDPSEGPANARVTIVMFSDFQCPSCSAAHPVLDRVMADYPGKIRFVVRDFPLESIHENAFSAAMAANAAAKQGKFFEYIDLLYGDQENLGSETYLRFAEKLGLNQKKFELDLKNKAAADEIRKDIADGEKYGVDGTPTIFINGIKVRHATPDALRKAIDAALAKK